MGASSALVKHAILSLSITYVMDYKTHPDFEHTARDHHTKAVQLLGQELRTRNNYSPGKEEAVVAALYLLAHNEVVNWEVASVNSNPMWYRSGKRAEYVLGKSDPAYNYARPENVQFSRARFALGQLFCLDNVISDCVYPLDLGQAKVSFSWLLEGSERDQRKIIGMTGLSAKLMHYFAKITFLSARLFKKPSNTISQLVAAEIQKRLENFQQRSELEPEPEIFESHDALLKACQLDEDNKVTTAREVTDLIAMSYVASAQIYLHSRTFRRPRQHPVIQKILERLLKCIDWQPTAGDLFTAQTPLFSVFLGGIVAYKPHHRALIHKWFKPICTNSRGNVPPAWRALQFIWEWLDAQQDTETSIEHEPPLSEAKPWWEDVVDALTVKEGRMNLS